MHVRLLKSPSFATKLADVNDKAFGFRQIPNISEYQIQQCIKNDKYDVYVVPDMGSIIGFLIVGNEPDKFISSSKEKCIEHFSVLPWKQGKGVGKTILSHVVNVAHPTQSFSLCVEAKNKAVSLYKKLGFVNYGVNHMVRSKHYIAMGLIRNRFER